MPIYEYHCPTCDKEFEELVRGDEIPPCPYCDGNKSEKLMSRPCFHVSGDGGGDYAPPSGGGGGCAGCSGGNCATCG